MGFLEITGAWPEISSQHTSAAGIPVESYAHGGDWEADSGFDITEVRLGLPLGRWSLMAQAERTPDLASTVSYTSFMTDGGSVIPVSWTVARSATLDVYDLALARAFHFPSGAMVQPLVGVTHLHGTQRQTTWPCEPPHTCRRDSDERYLGMIAGVEGAWPLAEALSMEGRLDTRWAGGHRDVEEAGFSSTVGSAIVPVLVRSTERDWRMILGAEAGLSWQALNAVSVAAGWRYDDWSYDGGPASASGPFVRLRLAY